MVAPQNTIKKITALSSRAVIFFFIFFQFVVAILKYLCYNKHGSKKNNF